MSLSDAASSTPARPRPDEFARTGPGTPAGEYLRRFWHPVYHSADLGPASAVPLRIMGQEIALYRAESGRAVLVDGRCPHRGTQLSTGWVEGEELRCFYHGWKFASDGRCTEQPAENPDFCRKVTIGAYPVREYLGLVFAYLGAGEPPAFPEHPEFEHFDGLLELDSYSRDCNFFQNLENALDMSHVGFVHGDNRAAFAGIGDGKRLQADESDWGVTYTYTRPDGQKRVQQFGMPNQFYMTALPTDPEIGWQESLFWWVPIDDDLHMQFSIHRVPASGEAAKRIHARRMKRSEGITIAHQDLCERILAGEASLRDADATKVDLVRLQDDIAQVGQGRIADRSGDRLGRADVGVIAIRKVWARELDNHLAGRATKAWRRDASIVPRAWSLEGGAPRIGAEGLVADGSVKAMIVDVRPRVEAQVQLRALHGRSKSNLGGGQA
jgi:5,5'-dehydrodivanillate O-demethylase